MVNEGLPCVERDIADTLTKNCPSRSRLYAMPISCQAMVATGNNSTGHIKSLLCGNHCMFPVVNGKIVCGGAQDIYLVEFDGPQTRRVYSGDFWRINCSIKQNLTHQIGKTA
ncbi:MAG: YjbQ family protein [Lachnospiraceae bacterium]